MTRADGGPLLNLFQNKEKETLGVDMLVSCARGESWRSGTESRSF